MTDRSSVTPTPLQTLILWALVVRGGASLQKDLKPELKKPDREALVRAGLLQSAMVGRAIQVELTDKAWSWTGANTGAALPGNSPAGTAVLAALLVRIGSFMAATNTALADIIRPSPRDTPTHAAVPPAMRADLAERIRGAYLAESGGAVNRRVRLAAIRSRLAEVPRRDVDAALLALAQDGTASLFQLDDPAEVAPADAAAAIGIGLEMRHLLWLHR